MSKKKENNKTDLKADIADFLKAFTEDFVSDSTDDLDILSDAGWEQTTSLVDLTLDNYNEVPLDDELETKISELQAITNSIENQIVKVSKPKPTEKEKSYKIDYANSLNPGQYLAATSIKGPVLVIAGAGSGKTRTITYRVNYMLEKGIPPEDILLLTFTRKAANEMTKRSQKLLKSDAVNRVMRGTFHAFANHVMRRYANFIDLSPNFTIVDTGDSEDIIDLIRSELKFDKKAKAFPRKSRVQNIISKSRNCNIDIKDVIEREFSGLLEYLPEIRTIAQVYHKYKRAKFIFDYDDLMEVLRDKLRDVPKFRQMLQRRFKYIMVDEFQDTNVVQKEIVDFLAEKHQNLLVVGDDAQSIYAFRGANYENILRFPAKYKNCKVIKLEENYRSNQNLLNFTNSIVHQATLGYKKTLFSGKKSDFMPEVHKYYDAEEEATFIVDRILELREKDVPLDEIAVLFRSAFHGRYIESELLRRNIPYVVVGGIKFIERRHVKDVLSYLRILLNPYDAVAWNRVLKLIPGIGKVTARKIVEAISENKGEFNFSKFEGKKFGDALLDLQAVLLDANRDDITLTTKIEILIRHYKPILENLEDDYNLRMKDIDILVRLSARYERLDRFLSDFALDPPSDKFQDQVRPLIDESEDHPVTLSTVHSAKGLEWHTVFVPHLLDGLFPSSRALAHFEYLEEERRLFYVACSRAKEELYLCMPSYLSSWDNYFTMPSRFLVEVENKHFVVSDKAK